MHAHGYRPVIFTTQHYVVTGITGDCPRRRKARIQIQQTAQFNLLPENEQALITTDRNKPVNRVIRVSPEKDGVKY
jgi:hypothetical protein